MAEKNLYFVGSILMAVAAILILFVQNYLASSAMLMSSALAAQHSRLIKTQSERQ